MQIRLLCSALFTVALVNAQTIAPQKNANGKWALVDNTGKAITPPIYKRLTATSTVGYIAEDAATKLCGLISYKGIEIIPCTYDSICDYHFSDELTAVLKNKKYGFINKQGQLVLPLEYDKVSDANFYKGFVIVKKGAEQFAIDNSGKKLLPSPEPYESNYNRALAAANNSKERAKVVEAYIKGIATLGYSQGQKVYLTAQKFIALVDVDYHAFFETMMLRTIQGDELKVCTAAYRSLKPEQVSAIKTLAQYVVDDFVATQNHTTPPPYPAGIPKPGFGWGKTTSSDKVFISQQTNLSDEQKYREIKNKLAAGQTVEQQDVSWSISYENTIKANEAYAKLQYQQDLTKAKALIGKYISYTVKTGKKNYEASPINAAGFYVMKVIGIEENYDNSKFVFQVRYTSVGSCNAINSEIAGKELLYGSPGVTYTLTDGKGTCSSCDGKGGGNYNYSHTNDYQYTYGAKVTYSGSTWVNCKTCGGSGKSKYIDYKFSCL